MKYALLIMPHFYAYAEEMRRELERRGYKVDLFYEEPPRILFLIMRRLSNWMNSNTPYKPFLYKLYRRIRKNDYKYSFFLVIRGNILNDKFIQSVKSNMLLPDARSVYYTWDSFTYLIHQGQLGNNFDYKYSFDTNDIKERDDWQLLPLFFTSSFDGGRIEADVDVKYDVACVAGFNEQRYLALKSVVAANPELKFYIRLYLDKKLYDYKIKTSELFRQLDLEWVSFELISPREVADIYLSSKAILDYTDHFQCGLSMRTIEAIGLRKKLITNNPHVKDYDFWESGNVFYMNEREGEYLIPYDWLEIEYTVIEEIRSNYSLSHWLDVLMDLQ